MCVGITKTVAPGFVSPSVYKTKILQHIVRCCSCLSFQSPCHYVCWREFLLCQNDYIVRSKWITSLPERIRVQVRAPFSATTATYRLNVLLLGAVIRSHKLCLADSTHCLHAHFLPVRCWVRFCEMVLELFGDDDSV